MLGTLLPLLARSLTTHLLPHPGGQRDGGERGPEKMGTPKWEIQRGFFLKNCNRAGGMVGFSVGRRENGGSTAGRRKYLTLKKEAAGLQGGSSQNPDQGFFPRGSAGPCRVLEAFCGRCLAKSQIKLDTVSALRYFTSLV